jgi:hypothetical protein
MDTQTKVTHSIIACQIALNHLSDLKHTNVYRHGVKRGINLLLPELIKAESDYDKFFNTKEDETVNVYEVYDQYIKAVASVPIWDCENIALIIEAYKKDPKAIEEAVQKVLTQPVDQKSNLESLGYSFEAVV